MQLPDRESQTVSLSGVYLSLKLDILSSRLLERIEREMQSGEQRTEQSDTGAGGLVCGGYAA
jgi:hypothetical protein